jgi:hypothetical protein
MRDAAIAAAATLAIMTGGRVQPIDAGAFSTHDEDQTAQTVLGGPAPLVGDLNCSGAVNSIDALLALRTTVNLPVNLPVGCPPIGSDGIGDVDCDKDVDPVDALKILRYGAGLSVLQNDPCADIGT